ncbi:MAG: ABC transporter substrate-binding protein [Turicibacter sp.]|nr:ABC transporter substrate-binding protein [Turicibacter sp.]
MKKLFLNSLVVGASLILGACGQAAEEAEGAVAPATEEVADNTEEVALAEETSNGYITVTHRSGETEVPLNPQNIAVFDMAILDSLDLLGLGDRVVGLPQNAVPYLISQFGEGNHADFGTLHNPNIEEMAGHDLDLIIISGRARGYFDQLSELAPTIDLGLVNSDIRGSFVQNQTYLGKIFGVEEESQAHIDEILALFDEAAELSAQLEDQEALIIMHNDGNLQAFGPGGRFGVIHDVFGVPYVDAYVGINEEGQSVNHGMVVDNEYVYSENPAIIFVIDRNYLLMGQDPENHEVDITNDIINMTTAGQNGHIFNLNPEAWYIAPGGLQSMRRQVSGVIRALETVIN